MKIILAQYFEIFQILSSGKIYNKNIMKLQEFEIPLGVQVHEIVPWFFFSWSKSASQKEFLFLIF